MSGEAERERAAVVAYLQAQMHESMFVSDSLPWWRFRLKFANKVAAAASRNLAIKIRNCAHLKETQHEG